MDGSIFWIARWSSFVPPATAPFPAMRTRCGNRYEERYPLYNAVCDQRIPAEGTIEENVELVLNAADFGKRTAR